MIQGLSALLPIINKAVDLVPDKNKIAKQKADIEKEAHPNLDVRLNPPPVILTAVILSMVIHRISFH